MSTPSSHFILCYTHDILCKNKVSFTKLSQLNELNMLVAVTYRENSFIKACQTVNEQTRKVLYKSISLIKKAIFT